MYIAIFYIPVLHDKITNHILFVHSLMSFEVQPCFDLNEYEPGRKWQITTTKKKFC